VDCGFKKKNNARNSDQLSLWHEFEIRNLQFAIVSGAMLFALCVQFEACQVGNENLSSAEKMQKC